MEDQPPVLAAVLGRKYSRLVSVPVGVGIHLYLRNLGQRVYGCAPEVAHHFAHRLAALLLPFPCLACGVLLAPGPTHLGLCVSCQGQLSRPKRGACRLCLRPLYSHAERLGGPLDSLAETPETLCGTCRQNPPPFECLVAAFDYTPPATAVIHGLKALGLDFLGSDLADEIATPQNLEVIRTCDVVTPIPLAWTRQWRRRYNQAASIAVPLAARAGIPQRTLLNRRSRPKQARLSRQHRLANLDGAFSSTQSIKGARVALVDDVVTTGSTLNAATHRLLQSGASAVVCVLAARTPRWSER